MVEQHEASDGKIRGSIVLLGFILSIAAGGLFSYVAEDTTPARYLLQLTSFFLIEAVFITFYAFLARKYGWKWFIPLAAAGLIASMVYFMPHFSITPVVFLKVMLLGLVIGQKNWFAGSFFNRMAATITPGLILALVFGCLIIYRGITPAETDQIRTETVDVYNALMQPDDAQNAADNAMLIFGTLFKISIAFITIFSLIEAWIAFMLTNWLSGRLRQDQELLPLFYTLKIPFHLIWVLLVSAFFVVLEVPAVSSFMLNILAIMAALYCFQGLAVAAFHLNRVSRGPLPKVLFWVIFFITIGVTGIFLILTGIIDNWYNLRALPTTGNKQEGISDESNS